MLRRRPPLMGFLEWPNVQCDGMDAVTQVAQALRRYLRQHPQACDTAAGIAAWWPLPAGRTPETVAAALALLAAGGEIECATGPDGQTVYRAAAPPGA
ncbi:hypothetical protein [Pseudorhodoferax sp.]|uniref:hypothetical protein n=1 Tax=Pseudorhodoferax sp. TaxID=1993553 RepID=UPI0039E57991